MEAILNDQQRDLDNPIEAAQRRCLTAQAVIASDGGECCECRVQAYFLQEHSDRRLTPTEVRFSAALVLLLLFVGCSAHRVAPVGAESLEVYYFPESSETLYALQPDDLRRTHVGFVRLTDSSKATAAWLVARDDVTNLSDRIPDLRWGLRVFDSRNKLLAEYYVDRTGHYGYANAHRAAFSGGFRSWLKSQVGLFDHDLSGCCPP